jgi:hypothetical protein
VPLAPCISEVSDPACNENIQLLDHILRDSQHYSGAVGYPRKRTLNLAILGGNPQLVRMQQAMTNELVLQIIEF